MSIQLRPYQADLIEKTRDAIRKGKRAPILVAPTGAGKTVMFSYFTMSALEKGNNILILAHRKELVDQISETLNKFEVPHSFVAPGYNFDSGANVHVASVFTIKNRLDKIRQPKIIIIDEAHHATSGSSWGQVLEAFPGAIKLGVTATPCRLDGRPLGKIFDEIILGPTVAELIKLKALSDYRAFAPTKIDTSEIGLVAGDYNKSELAALMSQTAIVGDCIREYKKRASGKRAMVFCVSIQHAQSVAEAFRADGIEAKSVDGTMDKPQRTQIIQEFRDGKIKVLTSCALVSEGFDLPAIEVAILLRPTKSTSLYLQQVGRSLRPFPGKSHSIILDHANNIEFHGLPDEEREWSLVGKVKRGNGVAPTKTCPECFAVVFASVTACTECGYIFQIKAKKSNEVDGDLVEVDKEKFKEQRLKEQGEYKSLDDLVRLGKQRGYKSPYGWAKHIMRARMQKAKTPNDA